MIAVNQLSCGAGDSLSKGMREAQIAISAPTQLVHPEMIFNHPHILDCSTQPTVVSHQTQLLVDFSTLKPQKKLNYC